VEKPINDWLSKLETWEEREHDEDIRRMARVIRELVGYIKLGDELPMKYDTEDVAAYLFLARKNLSPDAKELLK